MGKYLTNDNVPKYLGSMFTAASSAAIIPPTGCVVASGTLSIPAGTTIYGRYTEIDLAGGTAIAYYASKGAGAAETTTHANYAAAPGSPRI